MSECNHPIIQGDNYGETCAVCGEVLAGFGYWAKGSPTCLHKWMPIDNTDYEMCMYCEETRVKKGGFDYE